MPMCSAVHCSLSLAGGTPDYDATPVQYLAQLHVPGLATACWCPASIEWGTDPQNIAFARAALALLEQLNALACPAPLMHVLMVQAPRVLFGF
ncbi:hypothetical protein [Pseudomonas uvaldensis]|uniref:hypothetical protein n=1 Tax=Pseudomonas uvaldensis TaxID=2878385 RepID=UPI001E3C1B49|nr:hypothetical protein [Pseudomonas uvaldensis]MCE0464173.1 hypothetical protein [Pseudomonas uvaldensis]